MAYITALVIALTLAGQPVVNALCISSCDSPSDRHRGDEAIVNPTAPALAGAATTCSALTATPFLREEGPSVFHAVTTAAVNGVAARPCCAVQHPRVWNGGSPPVGRPLVVLRV